MLEHKKIQNLSDYFVALNNRQNKGVYFYRINGYSEEIGEFVKKYYDVARRSGVVIEGKIPNPDEKNLAYYDEIMGMDFRMKLFRNKGSCFLQKLRRMVIWVWEDRT